MGNVFICIQREGGEGRRRKKIKFFIIEFRVYFARTKTASFSSSPFSAQLSMGKGNEIERKFELFVCCFVCSTFTLQLSVSSCVVK